MSGSAAGCRSVPKGGTVQLTIVRDRKELTVQVPVAPTRPMLIPNLENTYPSYFVYGPLVFSPATGIFVGGLNNAMTNLAASASPLYQASTVKMTGGIETNAPLVFPASPKLFEINLETDTRGLIRMTPRLAWVETYLTGKL